MDVWVTMGIAVLFSGGLLVCIFTPFYKRNRNQNKTLYERYQYRIRHRTPFLYIVFFFILLFVILLKKIFF